jgi:phosphopantetheinyl transferase
MERVPAWISVSELDACLRDSAARERRCLDLWLTTRERERYARLVVPKRRREWLAGRVAAKELIRKRHGLSGDGALRRIEIAAPQHGPDKGKPYYQVDGVAGRFDLSISHSHDVAIAEIAATPEDHIGIDVEKVEPRDASFEALALTARERAAISGLAGPARALAVTTRWVLKEALSKALGMGLRLRFDHVTVVLDGASAQFEGPSLPRGVRARFEHVFDSCVAVVATPRDRTAA